ncbi:acyl-coenzyme A:6-aminopenicillanic acid acyl-transferase [Longilinea arvoryzae]|uniref:Acyl-coenzyme A:6-aminopenicillanic acid acyl-transferase n=1 Tax=Longilinea arvoryzae TaxID=360412 RepID=A0A0S7B9Q3_9CHLR|nr:C45 family peptidase [Longilinea arvoryzae]GAP14252.1 acyl-coenzyme A:6-aminopenicillanic acid acyl-transferase [Longilinea arvoryzae]
MDSANFETIIHTDPVPLIVVRGNHREIGRQIGEAVRPIIQHSVESAKMLVQSAEHKLHLTLKGARIQALKYSPFIQERYPSYYDEILGLAQGGDVPLEDLLVLNALEAVTTDALHLTKCTSLAVNEECTENKHVLVGHNEDWLPDDEPDVYLVHISSDDEPPFLAMTYGGLLPNIGFNAYGIAQCCDTVYAKDSRIGIPRVIVSRGILAAHTPGGAIRHTLAAQRAAGYNHLIAHTSGELYNVEVSAHRFAVLNSNDGRIVHTNHYLETQMRAIENEPDELIETRVRYARANRLLRQSNAHTLDSLKAVLRDHVNYPESICNHAVQYARPMDRKKTICSLIIDLTTLEMHLTWGTPCINEYHTYSLNA